MSHSFYFLFFCSSLIERGGRERYFLYSVDVSMASENTCSIIPFYIFDKFS